MRKEEEEIIEINKTELLELFRAQSLLKSEIKCLHATSAKLERQWSKAVSKIISESVELKNRNKKMEQVLVRFKMA